MAKDTNDTPAVVGLSPEQLAQILASVGQTNAQAMKQSLRPENDSPPPSSVFHPLGAVKPALARETFVCSVKQMEDTLTPFEIEAFNAITHDTEIPGKRWKARFDRNGLTQRLFVDFPCKSIDDRMGLPSIELICRELAGGEAAVDPAALTAEIARLRAQLAAQ